MSPQAPLSFRPDLRGWQFSLYPDASEGGGSYRRFVSTRSAWIAPGHAADPERSALEAGKRARRTLRRYCAANRLNRLGTLTYSGNGCHDPREIREHFGEFFRNLRTLIGKDAFPYAWVPEWHKTDHGLHAHFAVGQFDKRSLIEEAWGRGYPHIKLIGDLPTGTTTLGEARRAAGYLSKYVAKSFGDSRFKEFGLHRYDVAQGFRPLPVTLTGSSTDEVLLQASAILGSDPLTRWSSSEVEDWQGPPAIWAQWGR